MPTKKIIIYISITAVVSGIFFGPLLIKRGYADSTKDVWMDACLKSGKNQQECDTIWGGGSAGGVRVPGPGSPDECHWYDPFSIACILKLAVNVTYYGLWSPAALLMRIGAGILDFGINLSVSGTLFSDLAKGEAVNTGWRVARDIVNLLLIFILLYIAIATILQVSGYGAKELLLTLIIIAFLVNFSLVITRLIVDASNVLTTGFYSKFDRDDQGQISVSLTFTRAFDWEKIVSELDTTTPKIDLVRLLSLLFGTAVMLISGFIFAVFGLLFIIRMVALLILMILSPLALAAHILPSTKQHASKWWKTLFDQAFFAPAALFLLWISANIAVANREFITKMFGIGNKGIGDMFTTAIEGTKTSSQITASGPITAYFVQFVIVVIFLCMSLVVAKKMGAYGASTAMNWGKKARQKAQGYAGRISKRYAAPLAGAIMAGKDEQGKRTRPRWITKVPLVGRGLAQATTMAEPEISKYEKQYGSYSDAGLKVVEQRRHLLNMSQRKAVQRVIEKRAKKKKRQDILNDPNAPSIEKLRALTEEAEETVESAAKTTTTEKKETETKKT